eukprot:5907726-Amphidinium_carterae.1
MGRDCKSHRVRIELPSAGNISGSESRNHTFAWLLVTMFEDVNVAVYFADKCFPTDLSTRAVEG